MHIWIIIGVIAGRATGKIMEGPDYGSFDDVAFGIVGGLIGRS